MVSTAFVSAASRVQFISTWTSTSNSVSSPVRPVPHRHVARTRVATMSTEEPVTSEVKPTDPLLTDASTKTPTVDTTMFSDFVESTQIKIAEFQQQISEIDSEQVANNAASAGKNLFDNALAGDWLNRGELYGALQILLVLLLLQRPALDGFVALVTGPVLLFLGAGISIKSVSDLGFRQISVWPAPVPGGEFRCDGIYNTMRHPMYAGLLLASAGFSISTGSPARLAVTAAMAFLLSKKIEKEEEFLSEAYPEYEEYKSKVPYKIIPKIY